MKIQNSQHNKSNVNSNLISENTTCENKKSINNITKIHQIKKTTYQKNFCKSMFRYLNKKSSIKTVCSEKEVRQNLNKIEIEKKCTQQLVNINENKKIKIQQGVVKNEQKHDIQIQKQFFQNNQIQDISEPSNQSDFVIYTKEILNHLLRNENHYLTKNLLSSQTEITPNLRATLIQWLIQVHFKFQLCQETLFLCINIIDRILSHKIISKSKFQLLGITSLFIASKYEQIRPPGLQFFVQIGYSAYTKEQIISMEGKIMLALQFQMGYSSPLKFIDKTCILASISQQIKDLSYAIVELSLLDNKIYEYKPSIIGQSALILSYRYQGVIQNEDQLNEYKNQVKECTSLMSDFLKTFPVVKYEQLYKIIRSKYEKNKLLENLFRQNQ